MTANPLTPFLDLRTSVSSEAIGDGGPDTCAVLTAALDAGVEQLGSGMGAGAAVVALGGYGRGEQCLWSDVDLMLLHRNADNRAAGQSCLLSVVGRQPQGRSCRCARSQQCRVAGREQLETLTSLLSARLVVGDADLFDEFEACADRLVQDRPFVVAPRRARATSGVSPSRIR